MAYSEKLLDYFQNPRCVGEIPDAHAVAEVSNPVCGDVMKLWVKVANGRIEDARFKAQGWRQVHMRPRCSLEWTSTPRDKSGKSRSPKRSEVCPRPRFIAVFWLRTRLEKS